MPDVGILNLQIHDDSAKAADGLSMLVTKLEEMKTATSGIKLGAVASGIKRINDELNKVQPSAIFKLKQLADVLERISTISGNVGGIRISFGGRGQSAEDMAAQLQAARDAATQTTADFEQIGQRIDEDTQGAESLAGAMGKVNEIVQQIGWTAQATAEQFAQMFHAMNSMRMSRSPGAGASPFALGDGTGGSGADWTDWKDGAIEVEGTVTDAMDSVQRNAGDAILKLTGVKQETEEVASEFEQVKSAVQGSSAQMDAAAAATDRMQQMIDSVRKYWSDASDRMKEYISNLLGIDKNVLFPNDATANVNNFENAVQSASSAATTLQDDLRRDYGKQMVEDLVNASSKADLLKMKIDGLKDSLARKIDNNKIDEYGIAQETARIQQLQSELDGLTNREKDVSNETKSLAARFKDLVGVTGGLGGAFKRMFPTISGLLSRFKQMVKYRMLRAVIKQIAEGFREGTENYYRYSQAIGGEFATKMDDAASALLQMKNSVGAAAAPLINSMIPYLKIAVEWFINLLNYANQFIALLRGQSTWSRALPQTTSAFDDQTKAAKKTGAAIKDLLADWDELNIIQSEGGGGGIGSGTSAAEDYLSMFEEVDKFDDKVKSVVDFIKDNMAEVKTVIKDIGLALLAWKLSQGFTGWLSKLATIATIGFIVKLSFDAAGLADQAYIDSDDIAALVGDMVLTGALAGIAGKLAKAAFGKGAGLITAGIVFAVSASATFEKVRNAKNGAQEQALSLLGMVKAGIADALVISGFIAAGINPALAIIGGTLAVGLIIKITYDLKVQAEEAEKAEAMARNAFADAGEGGINASDYIAALQSEFDEQTAGSKLVLKAYVDVPDLGKKLTEAAGQISSFNQIIFKSEGKLTKEDAEEFKANWDTVISTLNSMDTASYNTILQGLTEALQSKSAELRAEALEIRKTFIMIEKNITAENADIYTEMEGIAGRLGTEAEQAGDLERYEQLYHVFAASTSTGFEELQKALDKGKTIDFGSAETAVANAEEFVKSVGESGNAALQEVQDALDAVTDSIEYKRRIEKSKYEAHLIDEDTYISRMAAFDQILSVAKRYAAEKTDAIQEKMGEAYQIVFGQALSAESGSKYWETVLLPLIKQASDAGAEIPQIVYDAFTRSINGSIISDVRTGYGIVEKIFKKGVTNPAAIAEAIKANIASELGEAEEEWEYALSNFFVSHANIGLDETETEIKDLLGISGWDALSKEWKQAYTDALINSFGEKTTREVLQELTGNTDEIEALLAGTFGAVGIAEEFAQYSSWSDTPDEIKQRIVDQWKNKYSYRPEMVKEILKNLTSDDEEISNLLGESFEPGVSAAGGTIDFIIDDSGLEPVTMPPINSGEFVQSAKEATDAVEDMTGRIGKAWADAEGLIHMDIPEGLSNDAEAYIIMMRNAVNSGLGMEEIQAAFDQAYGMFGNDAFLEALPYVEELVRKWKEMNGVLDGVDTQGIHSETDAAASAYESMASRIRAAFASLDGISFSFSADSGTLQGVMRAVVPIPAAANGAIFKSGDVFSANENGQTELIGSYGNRTAVMNNEQVVGAVTNGVAQANSGIEDRLAAIENRLVEMIRKGLNARVTPDSGWTRHAQASENQYSRVTG